MSRTVLAPLTTTFTPSPQCSNYGNSGDLSTRMTYWQAQSCSQGYPRDDANCWPPALVVTPTGNLFGFGMYSPGLHCPVGYVSACTAAMYANGSVSHLNIGTSFSFQFTLTAGETAIGCCPLGLTCANGGGVQTCVGSITTGQVPNPVGFCTGSSTEYYGSETVTADIGYAPNSGNKTLITISTATLFGPLIQLVFQSSDISSLPSPTSYSTSSISSSAIGSSATYGSSAASDNNSTSSGSDGGLSTGAKIGIGVGVPLAVLLVALLAAFILFRRRKRNQSTREPVPGIATHNAVEKPGDGVNIHGNYSQQGNGYYQPVGWKPPNIAEAPTMQRTAELDSVQDHRPFELPAGASR